MEFAQIWVSLKAESCWAALILYRIRNRTRYTMQIKIQNGSYLLVCGDTPGDTSQPCTCRFQGLEYRTPFHWAARAAEDDKLDILKFMVQLAKKASNSMQPPAYNMEDRIGDTPILRIFKSTAAVEFLLFDSGIDDLELRNPKNGVMLIERCVGFGMLTPRIIQRLLHQVNDPFDPPTFYSSIDIDMLEMLLACEGLNDDAIEMVDGEPLLHHCVQWDILSESILRSLQKQFAVKWRGILPAEAGNIFRPT